MFKHTLILLSLVFSCFILNIGTLHSQSLERSRCCEEAHAAQCIECNDGFLKYNFVYHRDTKSITVYSINGNKDIWQIYGPQPNGSGYYQLDYCNGGCSTTSFQLIGYSRETLHVTLVIYDMEGHDYVLVVDL